MRIRHLLLSVMCAAMAAATAGGVEVELTATDIANQARQGGVVTCGVPLAKGQVADAARLSASVGGKVAPAQFTPLAKWDDGSVRWALLDAQVDVAAGGKTAVVVRDDGKNVAPPSPAKAAVTDNAVTLSSGPLELVVDRKGFNLIKSVKVDGKELITAGGRGLVLAKAGGGEVAAGAPTEVKVEQAGPMRAVVLLRGRFPGVHNNLLGYTVRLTAYAGAKFVRMRVWLENDGQHGYTTRENKPKSNPEWFAFDGLSVELGLGLGDAVKASCEGAEATGRFKLLQYCKPAKERYDPAYGYKNMAWSIKSGDQELKTGERTDGVVALAGPAGQLNAGIRHFWQNYEKAIELDGSLLKLWLWPTEGQWPREFIGHACHGYANSMILPLVKKDLYNLPGSTRKGHEMLLDFSGRPAAVSTAELDEPLFPLASAAHYASTQAATGLFAPPEVGTGDRECDRKLAAWVSMARSVADPSSDSSIWHARRDVAHAGSSFEFGFMYGWLDFGDLAVPSAGTVSLHYDWPWIVTVNAMRMGDVRFMRLADEMVRHRTEIDQQWSDRALPQYRGFQRDDACNYANFHCQRFNYSQPGVATTWLAGVIVYYQLTGDPVAREAIDRTADALVREWGRLLKSEDYRERQVLGNMQAVGEGIFAFCGMYDLTGDRKWLDEAMKLFNGPVTTKWKAFGPHLHALEQISSQSYTADDIKYCYAIQPLCELHLRTGDENLFKLLKEGCDKEFPENFFDAPLFLANLEGYVARVTGEEDYMDQAAEHWIQAFPESKSPPVYLPNNSVWSRRTAMTMRTGHLLQWAAWKAKKK